MQVTGGCPHVPVSHDRLGTGPAGALHVLLLSSWSQPLEDGAAPPGALFSSPATHSPVTPEGCGPLGAASWPERVGGWEPEQWAWGTLPAAFGLGSWGLKLKLKAKVQPQLEQRPPTPTLNPLLEFAFLPFWCQALRAQTQGFLEVVGTPAEHSG